MTPSNLPGRIAAGLAVGGRELLRRLGRPALSRRSTVTLGLGLALLSSVAAWYTLGDPMTADEARPTQALPPTELLEPRIGRRIDPSLHGRTDRTRTRGHRDSTDEAADASSPMPPHPTDRVLPVSPTPPRQALSAPKVLIVVRGVMGLDRAQVKIGAHRVTVGDLREVRVAAGPRTLRWRAHERDAWRSGGSWRFEPGTTVMAFVTTHGLELRTLP